MNIRPDKLHQLERMLARGGGFYSVEDLFEHIEQGKFQSFASENTWVVTQVHEFPQKKVLDIVFIVGDSKDLPTIEAEQLTPFANSVGASMIIATGRLGWSRKTLPGWKPVSINFVKELAQ